MYVFRSRADNLEIARVPNFLFPLFIARISAGLDFCFRARMIRGIAGPESLRLEEEMKGSMKSRQISRNCASSSSENNYRKMTVVFFFLVFFFYLVSNIYSTV